MDFKIASVDSLIITFDTIISIDVSKKVKFYYEAIKEFDEVIDLIPSYTTLMITYDIFQTTYDELIEKIKKIKYKTNKKALHSKLFEIPVYYGVESGIDLPHISSEKKLSINEIISLHTSHIYNVFAIGFAPGFAYLGEVHEKIAMPRLQTPRKFVPKGSVAIANTQTAVYPQNSPGGWNIIGVTSFDMFDKNLESLCPVSMGDRIKFKEICKKEFIDNGGKLHEW